MMYGCRCGNPAFGVNRSSMLNALLRSLRRASLKTWRGSWIGICPRGGEVWEGVWAVMGFEMSLVPKDAYITRPSSGAARLLTSRNPR